MVRRDQTHTHLGKIINVFDPTPEMFNIYDIAYGLAHMCRFSGQAPTSVALHSLRVSWAIEDDGGSITEQLQGLLHDASEAYIADLPSFIKSKCPAYKAVERQIMKMILKRFKLPAISSPIIKEKDNEILSIEKKLYFGEKRYQISFLRAHTYYKMFLQRFCELAERYYFNERQESRRS